MGTLQVVAVVIGFANALIAFSLVIVGLFTTVPAPSTRATWLMFGMVWFMYASSLVKDLFKDIAEDTNSEEASDRYCETCHYTHAPTSPHVEAGKR